MLRYSHLSVPALITGSLDGKDRGMSHLNTLLSIPLDPSTIGPFAHNINIDIKHFMYGTQEICQNIFTNKNHLLHKNEL